jgi:NAD(P)-dependent dehydrogenase (short-subunit alcohol dehydrogenase family)
LPLIDLSGRVIVVTGGNSGIGLGIARGVVRAAGSVVIWGRREERNRAAVADLKGLGGNAASVVCDVADEEAVGAALEGTVERFGRLDGLVANAGVSSRTAFVEMTGAEWKRILDINLTGAFFSLRAAARHLIDQNEGGSLVGVSSVVALFGAPGQEHYSASKTAVTSLMRGLAVELARFGIRCNALLPGWTETELTAEARTSQKFLTNTTSRTPVRRWATPSDFEEVGAFLCDPSITFHTGDALVVDGGYSVF